LLTAVVVNAKADAITDWNHKSGQILVEPRLGAPPAIRVKAVDQTVAYDAWLETT
jgi:hypothetical protein